MTVCLIVLQFNKSDLTVQCAKTLKEKNPNLPVQRMLFADNGSAPPHAERLREVSRYFPSAEIVIFERNFGFGEAHNRLAAGVSEDYLLLLNNDTVHLDDAITQLIGLAEPYQPIAATCRLVNRDLSPQENCAGFYGFPHPTRKLTLSVINKLRQRGTPYEYVNYINGALLLIRTDLFRSVGGFDPSLFMYTEDLDLMTRLNFATSGRLMRFKSPRVVHLGGESSSLFWIGYEKRRLQLSQGTRVVCKYYGVLQNRFFAVLYALRILPSWLRFLFKGDWEKARLALEEVELRWG